MEVPKGRYSLDGIDLSVFGVGVESGLSDFLKLPERKEPITHDWQDANGLDVDLSRVFFKDREISIKMWILATGFADFWTKYNQFIAQWAKPFTHRLEIAEYGKSFFVYYKGCNYSERFTKINSAGLVAYKFTIILNEPAPQLDTTNTYIADDEGRFLIT